MNDRITTKNRPNQGIITIDNVGAKIFLGSTGSGEFPPIGKAYDRFSAKPTPGEAGIIVLRAPPYVSDHIAFHQYWWDGDKLISNYEIKRWANRYSIEKELGLVVKYRDWFYITGKPDEQLNCKVVDLLEMLKYIEGKISLVDLDRNARSFERRKVYEKRMAELQSEVETLKSQVRIGENRQAFHHRIAMGYRDEVDLLIRAVEEMAPLAKWLKNKFWIWLMPKLVTKFLADMKALEIVRSRNEHRIPMDI